MTTVEIRKQEWMKFFDDFSKAHQGRAVTVEEIGESLGDQETANGLPLVGITADTKGGENRIAMIFGAKGGANVNHFVEKPSHVWFRHSALEQYDAIEIEAEDGIKTLLQFRFVPISDTEHQLPG